MKGRSRERKGRGLRGTLSPFGSFVALKVSVWKENIVTTLQLLNTETDAFTLLLFPLPPNLGEKKKRKKKKDGPVVEGNPFIPLPFPPNQAKEIYYRSFYILLFCSSLIFPHAKHNEREKIWPMCIANEWCLEFGLICVK